MDVNKNARTTCHIRMLIVQRLARGWSVSDVAAAQGITYITVRKWRDRHAAGGEAGLLDRSSRPRRSPARLDSTAEDAIEALRRRHLSGPPIARKLGQPVSTFGQVQHRRSLGRLSILDPRQPITRYEREQPGELIHIDIKKLGASTASDTASPAVAPAKATDAQSAMAPMGIPARRHRRPDPPGIHPTAAQRNRKTPQLS